MESNTYEEEQLMVPDNRRGREGELMAVVVVVLDFYQRYSNDFLDPRNQYEQRFRFKSSAFPVNLLNGRSGGIR